MIIILLSSNKHDSPLRELDLTVVPFALYISVKLRRSHQEVGRLAFKYIQRIGNTLPSASNSDITTRMWGILVSRLNNALGALFCGLSCVHGLTTRRASFAMGRLAFTARQRAGRLSPSLFLYQNIVVCSLHTSYIFIVIFAYSFVLLVYIVYFISFFFHETTPIFSTIYCYSKYSYSRLY